MKINIGDKVKIVNHSYGVLRGLTGKVTKIFNDSTIEVHLDESVEKIGSGNTNSYTYARCSENQLITMNDLNKALRNKHPL